jgi:hypothetical protein
MRSRMAANESSAVGSVRTIKLAEVTYATAYPDTEFAADLTSLCGTTAACQFRAAGAKLGGSTINNTYTLTAIPLGIGSTGQRVLLRSVQCDSLHLGWLGTHDRQLSVAVSRDMVSSPTAADNWNCLQNYWLSGVSTTRVIFTVGFCAAALSAASSFRKTKLHPPQGVLPLDYRRQERRNTIEAIGESH